MDLRIGYDKEVESNNLIVVLVTVEGDKLSKAESKPEQKEYQGC